MRAGLSTIQQTLTPEAASVLNHAIAEATRRSHGQTTPLHVAATLLASPSGYLRQACIRSHPNSSHPLQCRALELCFSVALDRLPSAVSSGPATAANPQGLVEPPISNALMAALKRAQAHQRRGCPEQQQQPLLAVKVELEQLIVSILDDPSVSRVMREASFSSPAVKATIEQSLTSSSSSASPSSTNPTANSSSVISGSSGGVLAGLGFRPTASPLLPANRNLYLNPRLQQHQQQGSGGGGGGGDGSGLQKRDEVNRVVDILLRTKKRNPVLVGDSEPEALMREVLQRIEKRELGDGLLRNVQVISLEKEFPSDRSQIPLRVKELGHLIESRIGIGSRDGGGGSGVILDLGDLKWLVEGPNVLGGSQGSGTIQQQQQQQQHIVSEMGRAAVVEMGKLLARFGEGGNSRVWLIGTATCATYLRCQVYHPTMENDWDLQAVPIVAPRALPSMFPRIGGNGILSSSVESLAPPKGFPAIGGANLMSRRPSENTDLSRRTMCPVCMDNYEHELAKLVAKEFEKSSSDSKPESRPPLPQWLQVAKSSNGSAKPTNDQLQSKEQELVWKQKTEELLKRWNETCSRLHLNFHQTILSSNRPSILPLSLSNPHNSNLHLPQHYQFKLPPARNFSPLKMNNLHGSVLNTSERPVSPPGSPVKTDLVLGRPKVPEVSPEKTHKERINDLAGCTQDRFSDQQRDKLGSNLDAGSFKRLFVGLTEKVGWQPEAASAVASTVMQCKSGNGKKRGVGIKGDTWLLFIGPDKVGKKKMASALSELVCGTSPISVDLGSTRSDGDGSDCNVNFRGKTVLDRVAEAVRQNPFSVIVLEDVDQANVLVRGNIKRAMERGRLSDSHGREVSLGSVIFIMTADSLPENLKSSLDSIAQYEEKLSAAANSGWQLELLVGEKTGKRQADWLCPEDRLSKPRTEPMAGASFDLNLAAGVDEETREASRNSSDLTVEHEHEHNHTRLAMDRPCSSITEMMNSVDESIVFKPVDLNPLRRKVSDTVIGKFNVFNGEGWSLRIEEEALDRLVGSIWFGGAASRVQEWTERVLGPSFKELKSNLRVDAGTVVRLVVPVKDGCTQRTEGGDRLPSKVTIAVPGLCGEYS